MHYKTVECIYNRHFFETMYKLMITNTHNALIDGSETIWHIDDVEHILICEYGYKQAASGRLY